jgi:GNAT superfamily N-acetyltransferase
LTSHLVAVAEAAGEVVGFAYTGSFAPDIVELANIFVAEKVRSRGVGAALLRDIEDRARGSFRAVILVNSMLYPGRPDKRPAGEFYLRSGYQLVWSTGPTLVFLKALDPD